MELHRETDKALTHTMDDQERENDKLMQRTDELEASFNPCPLFVEPLTIVQLVEESLGQAHKIDKVACLLPRISYFVVESIKS